MMVKMKSPKKSRLRESPPLPSDVRGTLKNQEVTPTVAVEQSPTTPHFDGRSLQSTGRTLQFATRVHPDWKNKLHRIAKEQGLMYVEVLERSLDAFERELQANPKK